MPSLLSRRLKEMEGRRLLTRTTGPDGNIDYRTTPMADEIRPLVDALAAWAHHHVDPNLQLECLDDHLLMWNIRRKIQVGELPPRKVVVQFILEVPDKPDRNYWLIIRPDGETDLCMVDPRFDVDLSISADLRAFTSAWMGHSRFADEIGREAIVMTGDMALARSMPKWLRTSSYAASDREATPTEREPGAQIGGDGERRARRRGALRPAQDVDLTTRSTLTASP